MSAAESGMSRVAAAAEPSNAIAGADVAVVTRVAGAGAISPSPSASAMDDGTIVALFITEADGVGWAVATTAVTLAGGALVIVGAGLLTGGSVSLLAVVGVAEAALGGSVGTMATPVGTTPCPSVTLPVTCNAAPAHSTGSKFPSRSDISTLSMRKSPAPPLLRPRNRKKKGRHCHWQVAWG